MKSDTEMLAPFASEEAGQSHGDFGYEVPSRLAFRNLFLLRCVLISCSSQSQS